MVMLATKCLPSPGPRKDPFLKKGTKTAIVPIMYARLHLSTLWPSLPVMKSHRKCPTVCGAALIPWTALCVHEGDTVGFDTVDVASWLLPLAACPLALAGLKTLGSRRVKLFLRRSPVSGTTMVAERSYEYRSISHSFRRQRASLALTSRLGSADAALSAAAMLYRGIGASLSVHETVSDSEGHQRQRET